MQLDLTKKQLKILLELVYLGNWMVNAQRTGSKEDPQLEEHDALARFIYSKVGETGFDKELKFDKEMNEWYPTYDFEMASDVAMYHDDYDNETFWDELPERLAWRDLRQMYGGEEITQMSPEIRMSKVWALAEKYEQEFEENELNRLVIDRNQHSYGKKSRNEPCHCRSGKKYKKCCGQ